MNTYLTILRCCAVLLLPVHGAFAQSLLQRQVTVQATDRPLAEVLQAIGRQGGFSFSYNSKLLSARKPVSINARQQAVRTVLDKLLDGDYQYKEVGGHIVLQPLNEKWYILSGYVQDATTGQALSDASVYERNQLIAANTNEQGFFRLKLRDRYPVAQVTISKEFYMDTSITFTAGGEQVYNLPVRPIRNINMDSIVVKSHSRIGSHFLGRLFLSSRQKIQALNIAGFMADKPYQISLVPGIGTHGSMSGQVINKASLNILGGYTAGTSGFEVAGLFNLSKETVKGTQVAGVFNIVGGRCTGAEIAGLYNGLQDSVDGAAVAGIANIIDGASAGVAVAGVINHVAESSNGTQVAGVVNIERATLQGVQVAGVVNYARKVKGLQVGLVNIADSTDGYMLGLVNLSRNGYHKAMVYANEVMPLNLALKTGNRRLYTVLLSGFSFGPGNRAYSFGAGIGRESVFSRRLSLTTDVSVQHLYLGDWAYANFLYRGETSLHFRVNKYLSVFAGTSVTLYQAKPAQPNEGYKSTVAPYEPQFWQDDDNISGWIGWQAGISLF